MDPANMMPFEQVLFDKGYRLKYGQWYPPEHKLMDVAVLEPKPGRRIRQNPKPLLNKLESEWFNHLKSVPAYHRIRCQAVRFRIANGIYYTPDFTCLNECGLGFAFEVKGRYAFDGSLDKLKLAANEYPEVQWNLVWKENGAWKSQTVLPVIESERSPGISGNSPIALG